MQRLALYEAYPRWLETTLVAVTQYDIAEKAGNVDPSTAEVEGEAVARAAAAANPTAPGPLAAVEFSVEHLAV